MAIDLFVGLWELDPSQSNYQVGDAPKSGTYRISKHEGGYLITMAWTDAQGRNREMAYEGTPDGIQYPLENSIIADGMSMTRVDEYTLDSATYKGRDQIAHARRELSEDGNVMTVTQSGKTPDGKDFANIAVYNRR